MGTCLIKQIFPILTNTTTLTNLNIPSNPNNKNNPIININNQATRILSYFALNEPDIKYTINNFHNTCYDISIPIPNNPREHKIIYSFTISDWGYIHINNNITNIDKFLNLNFSIFEIITTKYSRNKRNKYFVIKCNFDKYGINEHIKYIYKFSKGLQYKLEFIYNLNSAQISGIRKCYFANQVYICKKYSNLHYDTNKIVIQNKYEFHYYSKYFHLYFGYIIDFYYYIYNNNE